MSHYQPQTNVLSITLATDQTRLNGKPISYGAFITEMCRMFRKYPACLTEQNQHNIFWIYPAEHYVPVPSATAQYAAH